MLVTSFDSGKCEGIFVSVCKQGCLGQAWSPFDGKYNVILTGLLVGRFPDVCVAVASLSSKDKEISAIGDKPCMQDAVEALFTRRAGRSDPASREKLVPGLEYYMLRQKRVKQLPPAKVRLASTACS